MPIRRTLIMVTVVLLTLAGLAGPAWAGGRPQPPPDRIGPAIATSLLVIGVFVAVLAVRIMFPHERR